MSEPSPNHRNSGRGEAEECKRPTRIGHACDIVQSTRCRVRGARSNGREIEGERVRSVGRRGCREKVRRSSGCDRHSDHSRTIGYNLALQQIEVLLK